MVDLSREAARQVDRLAIDEYGMTGLVLMENAGRGCADVLCSQGTLDEVLVLCGKGNNGGDGLVIARHLDLRGIPVRILLCCDPESLLGDAKANLEIARRSGLTLEPWQEPPSRAGTGWCVDALLGTGAQGSPRPPLDTAITWLNAQDRPVLSVDIPSGLDCDTGQAAGEAVEATITCTFVAPKIGFRAAGASRYLGEVHVLDIGAPRALVEGLL